MVLGGNFDKKETLVIFLREKIDFVSFTRNTETAMLVFSCGKLLNN